jgi:hypothetical protein
MSEAFFTCNRNHTQPLMMGMLRLFSENNSTKFNGMIRTVCNHDSTNPRQVHMDCMRAVHNQDSLYLRVEPVIVSGGNVVGFLYYMVMNILRNRMRNYLIDVYDRPHALTTIDEYQLPMAPSAEEEYLLKELWICFREIFSENQIDFMLNIITAREVAEEEGVATTTWWRTLDNQKKLFREKYSEYKDFRV